MTRLLILVEGQSEEIFVKRTLAPYLANQGVYLQPPIVLWTKRFRSGGGHRGGVCNWDQIRRSLDPLTRDGNAWITMLLDFYGLPVDVPGYQKSSVPMHPRDHVLYVQEAIATDVSCPRFIPFLSLHELEAWVFCAPEIVAEHFAHSGLVAKVNQAVAQAGEPELINHGETSHPKARLKAMVSSYKETSDGPTLLDKIGIATIRAACPHFASWLDRLEALA